jgi:hypothetical protein
MCRNLAMQAGEFNRRPAMKAPKSNLALTLVLLVGAFGLSAQAKATEPRCSHSLEQYAGYARELASFASRARQQADKNPLFESDVQYYEAELADVEKCINALASIAPAVR